MVQITTLPNGVRIIAEHIPYVRSVAIGIWVAAGSRHEKPGENGISHFIEHMVFKGTPTRSAADIAEEMDAVGGQTNAFTTKDCTAYYAKTLDSHAGIAADILCDMFFHSCMDDHDVELERGVILEEIGMYKDLPEELVADQLGEAIYHGDSLGRPILGTKKTLAKMNGAMLKEYMRKNYTAENTYVSVAGSFDSQLIETLSERFSKMPNAPLPSPGNATYRPCEVFKRQASEQNHIIIAFPGITNDDADKYTMQVLNGVLGGGMSSRLFQKLREQSGLCYSVYSYTGSHADTGSFCIYTALGKATETAAIRMIADEVRALVRDGVTTEELERSREQLKANTLMGFESTGAKMSYNARSFLTLGYIPDADELIAGYDSVTADDIQSLARRIFDFEKISISVVGRLATPDEYRSALKD